MNAGPDYWYEARAVRLEEKTPVKKVKPGRLLIAILFLFLSAILAELAGLLVYAHAHLRPVTQYPGIPPAS